MILIYQIKINDTQIAIAVNRNHELKIGSYFQYANRMMRQFSLDCDDAWFEIVDINGNRVQLLHIKKVDGALMCNLKEGLSEFDTEFPYVFLNPIELKAVEKLAKETDV